MPDHRDLYLLIAGVLAGLLLGPAVLGRALPEAYDQLFVDVASWKKAQKEQLQQEIDRRIKALEATGATGVAKEQVQAELQAALRKVDADHHAEINDRLDQRLAWILGLGAAMATLMVAETLIDPHATGAPARLRSRLVSARYALLATAAAIILAQPALLRRLPGLFIALALAITLIAIAIPIGKMKSRSNASPT